MVTFEGGIPSEITMAFENPFTRLSDEQIERALDTALASNDNEVVHEIIHEIERRGHQLVV